MLFGNIRREEVTIDKFLVTRFGPGLDLALHPAQDPQHDSGKTDGVPSTKG